jgi:mannose-6-phosphate isomerase-like protein (cupin superfamily)
MSDYTKVNLREVEDSAEKHGLAPKLSARFAAGALQLEKSGVSLQRLAPDFRMPFAHRHREQEELYLVLEGSGRAKLDDEIVELRQWDVLRIPAHVTRCVEAGPAGMELLAFGAPNVGHVAADAEQVPNWWTD